MQHHALSTLILMSPFCSSPLSIKFRCLRCVKCVNVTGLCVYAITLCADVRGVCVLTQGIMGRVEGSGVTKWNSLFGNLEHILCQFFP